MSSPITLEQAQAQLAAWLAASLAVASGKEHVIGTRRLRLEDTVEIRKQIEFWESRVLSLQSAASGNRSLGHSVAVFVDE